MATRYQPATHMLDFPKVEESLISDLFTDIAGLSQRHLYLWTFLEQG
jgi:hypothetical protein